MKRPKLPLQKGDTGPHVQVLQYVLMMFGCTVPPILRGRFSINTEIGVKELQEKFKLRPTGVFDLELHRELEKRGLNFFAVVEFLQPHAPYYVGTLPPDITTESHG